MTIKYNPQLKIEIVRLTPEGEEEPIDVQIIPEDLSHHAGNKPPRCQVNIQKALGSVQQQCTITLHNAPIIEEIRRDFAAFIPKIRDEFWRVYVWAWWSNSPNKTDPESSPVFIGDISDDFQVQSSGINDSSLTLTANGHHYLMRSGKYRKTYLPETSYREIVDDIFAYFITKGYGPKIVIQDFNGVLDEKTLVRSFSVNRNPVETMNDICRELDFTWGVDAKTLYIIKRDEFFLDDLTPEIVNEKISAVTFKNGLTSFLSFGKWTFGFELLYDSELSIGKFITISEYEQINKKFAEIFGRVNEISYQLDNYTGHKMAVTCQFSVGDEFVDLPPRRDDSSGQRY